VAALDETGAARMLRDTASTLELARQAIASGQSLAGLAAERLSDRIDLSAVQLLLPIDGIPPERVLVSGTGLTHLGSAEGRDKMHKAAANNALTELHAHVPRRPRGRRARGQGGRGRARMSSTRGTDRSLLPRAIR